jgi:hypothetical protein
MKPALLICGGVFAIVAVILIIGAALPREHHVAREIMLRRAPREVYGLIRDFESAAGWRSNLTRVEILEPVDGRVRFREHAKDGRVTYEVVDDVPGERVITRIVDRDLGYSGSWTYEFFPVENGARLRLTEDGEVSNVLFRFMSRFVFGHTATIDAYLAALRAKLGDL